jgi:hypothetical protein
LGGYGLSKGVSAAVTGAENKIASLAAQKIANTTKDETWQAAKQAGYVVPPSAVKSSLLGNRLESISGKAAISQEAAAKNQAVTNKLAAKFMGLPDDVPVSASAIDDFMKEQGKVYAKVASLSDDAKKALELMKQAQFDTKTNFNYYNRSLNPDALLKAKAAQADADTWFKVLLDEAQSKGEKELIDDLLKARVNMAKAGTVERALNKATGNVHADVFGRLYEKGYPLSGEGEVIGRFASAFGPYARAGEKIPTPGVSKSEAIAAAILGIGGSAATGNPAGAALAALPLVSTPVRKAVLSKAYQSLLKPNYKAGMATRLTPHVLGPFTYGLLDQPRAAQLVGLLGPSIYSAQEEE